MRSFSAFSILFPQVYKVQKSFCKVKLVVPYNGTFCCRICAKINYQIAKSKLQRIMMMKSNFKTTLEGGIFSDKEIILTIEDRNQRKTLS
jgi:hypothetical protein